MVRLKHANDEKSTSGGREFHTFMWCSEDQIQHRISRSEDNLGLRTRRSSALDQF